MSYLPCKPSGDYTSVFNNQKFPANPFNLEFQNWVRTQYTHNTINNVCHDNQKLHRSVFTLTRSLISKSILSNTFSDFPRRFRLAFPRRRSRKIGGCSQTAIRCSEVLYFSVEGNESPPKGSLPVNNDI